jgi:hypothetical protein
MACMSFPPVRTYSDEPLRPSRVHLPEGALWLDSLDYDDLGFAVPRPQDSLGYDGMRRAECNHDFVNGWAWVRIWSQQGRLGCLAPPCPVLENAVLLVRYRTVQGTCRFVVMGCSAAAWNWREHLSRYSSLSAARRLASTACAWNPAGMQRSSWMASPLSPGQRREVCWQQVAWQPVPQILEGPLPNSLILNMVIMIPVMAWPGQANLGTAPALHR